MDVYFDKEKVKQTKLFIAKEKPDLQSQLDKEKGSESTLKAISLDVVTADEELRKFLIEVRSRALIKRSMYYEGITLLEEIASVDEDDIGVKLLMAECYLQLGREIKAQKAIKDIENFLSEPTCMAEDVMALVDDFISNKSYVRALILLRIRIDSIMKSSRDDDVKLKSVFLCVGKLDKVVGAMLTPAKTPQVSSRSRVIALDYGVSFMEKILENLRTLKCEDLENKTLKLAICANVLNSHYSTTHQHAKAIDLLKNEIKLLEKYFGEGVENHRIYGTLLHNLGAELHNSGKLHEAEKYKKAAMEVEKSATDYANKEEKQKDLEELEESLRTTRVRLKS